MRDYPRTASSRVGVFGGTFDPPHLGHARAASEVLRVLALDRVLWIPSHLSPHKRKKASSPPGVRWEMVCAALRGEPAFEATRAELDRGGVSYTIDTLQQIQASHPQWELFLILGPDLIDGLGSWRAPVEIACIAQLVALRFEGREGLAAAGVGGESASAPAPSHVVDLAPCDISSSRIRRRVARGRPVSHMVVPAVLAIIQSRKLYMRRGDVPPDPEST
ncbi:MAG: nicotinate-nucleotide adenylyltransferase [Gemmatimonadetes bacterium]|nr:nicotinate-nucleotide adenylyltransferase [Gemmatimonadota bacterium]MCY3944428.1 nicotinate-nucleotide adenylyltransferase [Gemmatimonadota bacterium]